MDNYPSYHFSDSTHQNEFIGTRGSFHLISPIGYNTVMKNSFSGSNARSALEQFEIHSFAAQFESAKLFIPKPIELVHYYAYTMEQIFDGVLIHPYYYKQHLHLLQELYRFYKHMEACGYFPYNYSIFLHQNKFYTLLDFSCFGTLSNGFVRFKHLSMPISILDAEKTYGFASLLMRDCALEEVESEKIETSDSLL